MQSYVNTLPLTTTADELRHLFAPYGTIETASIVTAHATGRPRGYSFVEMPYATEAQAAIARLDRTSLGGRTLRVEEARPREERWPRGEDQGWPRWEARGGCPSHIRSPPRKVRLAASPKNAARC